jgi:putative tryptophan/tyrosine transport system substrate-binding protein
MVNAHDPVGEGLVASLARPGGNITGLVQVPSAELAGKRIQLLKVEVLTRAALANIDANRPGPADALIAPGLTDTRSAPVDVQPRPANMPPRQADVGPRPVDVPPRAASIEAAGETDSVAGVRGLELRYPSASHAFEILR